MKSAQLISLITILAILGLAACETKTSNTVPSSDSPQSEKISTSRTSDTKNFTKGSFSVDYPDNWQLDASGSNRTSFIVSAPRSSKKDIFQENVSLMINDISSYGYTMDQFVQISQEQIKEVFIRPNIISSESVQDERGPSHLIVYTGTQRNLDLKYMQRYWIQDGKSYILSYSAQTHQYDRYLDQVTQIFDSFQIK